MLFQGVSQVAPRFEAVLIVTAHALAFEIASSLQIDHDSLDGSFRD